ncbi:MAG: indole-3-glycerol phosphate synthase TrpC [Candidatus Eisenbacteria bacterium]|uniref:Indole-3-glycerol phosphate synthase n=1 Tax=Eiseniibacteriota bacterium TaxID=2212470 RepID=A0A948W679_UNCEI|nr:indole-3-glycerol phosphate synthase TrpC [Candidatus Eisenbacteria bacterium]MBU1950343.1 indole-3-glycerol phosphate synthase TrpC [Candidatus Eisenbacteria bacterium]MBU2690356.1 indole-3-glycerol phosphate synthase TrpC [Candidatus Eisenbacteria bacterium]
MTHLEAICRRRAMDVRHKKKSVPMRALEEHPLFDADRRSLAKALSRGAAEPIRWICELKKASPSAGPIRPDLDIKQEVEKLAQAGASGFSILTEPAFFGGSDEDLIQVRGLTEIPLLRKDFIIDEYQIVEARSIGADAILLIVAALDPFQLRDLSQTANDLQLERLVEIHDLTELDAAVRADPEMIGVNNRNLRDMAVSVDTSLSIIPKLPESVVRISESGIRDRETVLRLEGLGADGILIGEFLMRSENPSAALRLLRGLDPTGEEERV